MKTIEKYEHDYKVAAERTIIIRSQLDAFQQVLARAEQDVALYQDHLERTSAKSLEALQALRNFQLSKSRTHRTKGTIESASTAWVTNLQAH